MTTSVVGSAAIGAYLLHAEMDSVRLENLTSSSIIAYGTSLNMHQIVVNALN